MSAKIVIVNIKHKSPADQAGLLCGERKRKRISFREPFYYYPEYANNIP